MNFSKEIGFELGCFIENYFTISYYEFVLIRVASERFTTFRFLLLIKSTSIVPFILSTPPTARGYPKYFIRIFCS